MVWAPLAYSTRGWVLAWLGRRSESLIDLERGARLHEAAGARTHLALFYARWAEGLLLAGDLDRARDIAERARELSLATSERANEALALYVLAQVELQRRERNLTLAEDLHRAAHDLATALGMRPLIAHCLSGLAALYRLRGKQLQADEALHAATTMYRDMHMTHWLERATA